MSHLTSEDFSEITSVNPTQTRNMQCTYQKYYFSTVFRCFVGGPVSGNIEYMFGQPMEAELEMCSSNVFNILLPFIRPVMSSSNFESGEKISHSLDYDRFNNGAVASIEVICVKFTKYLYFNITETWKMTSLERFFLEIRSFLTFNFIWKFSCVDISTS